MKPLLLAASAFLTALGAASPSAGQDMVSLPQPIVDESGHVLSFGEDEGDRMTVPVNIGASGPHLFVIDTGSERTVISRELARALDLVPGRPARMHSMTEVSTVSTVVIPELQVGGKSVHRINAPALERRNLGAEGLLGVDTLQSQRVLFDFVKQEMTVTPSRKREPRWPSDTIVITAKSRFGHLVLVDATVEGQKVWVIVDTGSEATVANNALRRKLERKGRLKTTIPVALTSVTGSTTIADQGLARRIRIGGIEMQNLPLVFADAHPFRKLGLMERPAILLGMDALQLFERVSVDFANRTVKILPGDTSALQPPTRVARTEGARPAG
ncbi:retroviral-like aspartic protease family protein [Sphingosinicella rhizophila]|uniref:Retroviral-like aspartic protease family protein n=1 Tax=Sphingosinicella rhizophila TaxID=3050082 RepID=A0ABU3Q6P5_9SPHN|nr:retroviral-like aspartic protease family protein [Sphingosinicella sp. GR2756]MDT9599075.1 retroviral-like aspartic protease family protein [Sphingosinicella sp. GR2756]